MACNGCVDVCPENLIRLVGLSKLIEDPQWMAKAVEEFGDIRAVCRRKSWTSWAR